MAIRDALLALREFYRARLAEYESPDVPMDETDRVVATREVRAALVSVERRLAIAPTS